MTTVLRLREVALLRCVRGVTVKSNSVNESPATGLSYGATIVTRPGGSENDCEKLCRDEAEIECNYYEYEALKGVCTLANEADSTIPTLKRLDETAEKSSADSWVTQLQARVLALEQKDTDTTNLHKAIVELREEIESLKSSRAQINNLVRSNKEQTDQNIAAVDDKVELVEGDVKRLEDTVLALGDMQKSLGNKIRQLNEDLRATSLTVTMLSQTSKDQRGTLRELGSSITEIRTSISDLKKSVTDLQVRFAGLSTDVMEKVGSVDAMVGPELKDLKNSQTTLAEALGLLTKKIMAISPRIPELQKLITAKDGKFTTINIQVQSLGRQLSFFSDRLSFSESQLKHIIDPASRINVERRQNMMHIQGQVDILVTAQTRMKNDLLAEILDRSRIYKEISELKMDRKSMLDEIVNQDEQMQDIKKALKILIEDMPRNKLVSNILSRQLAILRSLRKMNNDQVDHRNSFVKYKANIESTQREMMRQIEVRRATDQALITMQAKLVSAYHNIKTFLEYDNTKTVVKNLIYHHNQVVQKIDRMKIQQLHMTEALQHNRWVIRSVRTGLEIHTHQRENDLQKLMGVKRKLAELYSLVLSYKATTEPLGAPTISERLVKMSAKQTAIQESLSQYRADLQKTQSQLAVQRKQQITQAWKSLEMLHDVHALHGSYATLVQHENLGNKKLEDLHNLISEQLEKQARLIFSKVSSNNLISEIRRTVAEELERQNRQDAIKLQQMAQIAEINHGITVLKHQDREIPVSPMLDEVHHSVLDLLDSQDRRKAEKIKQIDQIADLNRRFRFYREHHIENIDPRRAYDIENRIYALKRQMNENKKLKQEIKLQQNLLAFMRKNHMLYYKK